MNMNDHYSWCERVLPRPVSCVGDEASAPASSSVQKHDTLINMNDHYCCEAGSFSQ